MRGLSSANVPSSAASAYAMNVRASVSEAGPTRLQRRVGRQITARSLGRRGLENQFPHEQQKPPEQLHERCRSRQMPLSRAFKYRPSRRVSDRMMYARSSYLASSSGLLRPAKWVSLSDTYCCMFAHPRSAAQRSPLSRAVLHMGLRGGGDAGAPDKSGGSCEPPDRLKHEILRRLRGSG